MERLAASPTVLCRNCPWRRRSPKAGEAGGSVPKPNALAVAKRVTEGLRVMQCHNSTSASPRPCAGYLSKVGYGAAGVRLAVAWGIVRHEDVGRPIRGLYNSTEEMLREADHIYLKGVQS